MSLPALAPADLALAAALLLVNGAIPLAFGFGLERSFAVAVARMAVQIGILGVVLVLALQQASPLWMLLVALAMALVAAGELARQRDRRFPAWWAFGIGGVTLLLSGALITLYAAAVVLGSQPWHAPRVVLPVFGMVLAAALTGASLALQTLTDGAESERAAIEARLALGATRYAAFRPVLARALRAAGAPLVGSMAVAGVVGMPGMMAGMIMAGADPGQAARLQLVMLCALACASGLGALVAALGGVLILTDTRHRLRLDRLVRA